MGWVVASVSVRVIRSNDMRITLNTMFAFISYFCSTCRTTLKSSIYRRLKNDAGRGKGLYVTVHELDPFLCFHTHKSMLVINVIETNASIASLFT